MYDPTGRRRSTGNVFNAKGEYPCCLDTHAHYDDEAFDPDRREVLAGLPPKGVGLVGWTPAAP